MATIKPITVCAGTAGGRDMPTLGAAYVTSAAGGWLAFISPPSGVLYRAHTHGRTRRKLVQGRPGRGFS